LASTAKIADYLKKIVKQAGWLFTIREIRVKLKFAFKIIKNTILESYQ
jgi:hypothetical protein